MLTNKKIFISEKKRRIYDQYGKEGLYPQNESSDHHHNRYHHQRGHNFDDGFMDPFAFSFVFRDPEDVFRDFFGGSFNDLFFDSSSSHSRNNSYHHHHHHRNSHPQSNEYSLSTNFMNPFMGMSMMDDFFRMDNGYGGHSGNGFTSIQTMNTSFGGGGGGGSFKRTSQSTSIVNGKKITTKV